MNSRLTEGFFLRDVLQVAPEMLGKTIARRFDNGLAERYTVTEVEVYRGVEDLACHASKGRTPRTEVMFQKGGQVYVYLIYGIYWMLNIVTGPENDASAILIRGVRGISGPGKVGKALKLDKSFYGENLQSSKRIWIEDAPPVKKYSTTKRIGINYAGEFWSCKLWRFIVS
ncbi:MAG: DNA-3-methyladenine glycosylase [Bacteroidota bacterium]